MNRFRVAALGAALALASVACCPATLVPPAVVAVVEPYVAVLVLADTTDPSLGRTGCDLHGVPVIWLHRGLPPGRLEAVLLHERVHVAQMRAYGCEEFAERYDADAAFRLHAEAEAFCVVFDVQTRTGSDVSPDLVRILEILTQTGASGYNPSWTQEDVKAAMRCWPKR